MSGDFEGLSQQDRESYNTMNSARRMLSAEADIERRQYGSTARYKALILGVGALSEILDNIDRNNGTFIQATVIEKPDVSKWRNIISRLTQP